LNGLLTASAKGFVKIGLDLLVFGGGVLVASGGLEGGGAIMGGACEIGAVGCITSAAKFCEIGTFGHCILTSPVYGLTSNGKGFVFHGGARMIFTAATIPVLATGSADNIDMRGGNVTKVWADMVASFINTANGSSFILDAA
jgi:hypothetical protein